MKRRIFILVLALLVAFSMMPATGFAASKIVTKSMISYEKRDGEWLEVNKSLFYYNKKAQETKQINRFYDNYDDGSRYTYKNDYMTAYDSKGRVKQTIAHRYGTGYFKDVYTYTTKNRVKKIKHYFKEKAKNSYKYDGYTIFYYSTKNKKNTEKNYNKNGKLEYKTITTLDSKLRPKTEKTYYYNGGKKELGYTYSYTYYKDGTVKTIEYESDDYEYEQYFNEKGRIKKEIIDSSDEDITTTYYYDGYGRLKKEVTKGTVESDEGTEKVDSTKTYKYSGYYKKHKYPKKVLSYWNGEKYAFEKVVYTYKTIG